MLGIAKLGSAMDGNIQLAPASCERNANQYAAKMFAFSSEKGK
jgi:hypothetical protein